MTAARRGRFHSCVECIENIHVLVRNADAHHHAVVGTWCEGELEEGAAAGLSVGKITCRRFTRGGNHQIELSVSGTGCPAHGGSEEVVELRKPQRLLD